MKLELTLVKMRIICVVCVSSLDTNDKLAYPQDSRNLNEYIYIYIYIYVYIYIHTYTYVCSYINIDTNAKSLAYPQDSRIGVRPLAVWKRLLVSALLYIFIISYGDTDDSIFMNNGGKQHPTYLHDFFFL